MKLMFASDLHGSAFYAKELVRILKEETPDKCVLLGDLLYHGPRNALPQEYAPMQVVDILKAVKQSFLCVRGNCDAEIDAMVLDMPIEADYAALFIDGHMFFVTHGHLFNEDKLPMLNNGDVFIQGHTHVSAAENKGDYYFLNPGSLSIPKDGTNSYMIYENNLFTIKTLDGTVLKTLDISGESL
ncbi:MAG: phosphodiesterase [Oscillospiraceae bacterium]